MTHEVRQALQDLRSANPLLDRPRPLAPRRVHRLHKVLVANRGEIAKRFFFALKEEGIPSVAIVTDPDRRQSWYEFADEVVYIGDARHYASIPVVLAALLLSKADALYPGYGFLSESHRFVEAIAELSRAEGRELVFMGPPAEVGVWWEWNSVAARPGSDALREGKPRRVGEWEAPGISSPALIRAVSGLPSSGRSPITGATERRSECRKRGSWSAGGHQGRRLPGHGHLQPPPAADRGRRADRRGRPRPRR